MMNRNLVVALAGNPNCGKTSLFNELTGSKQHVGNWPGVTVEKKEGKLKFEGREITIVDLPGTYSLGAYSEDEVVARDFILKDKPDVVINVVDACNLERNLYLTTQILETGAKVVLALNMMDEANTRNIDINIEKLQKSIGIPVVPTVATKKQGIKELVKNAIKLGDSESEELYTIDYGSDIQKEVDGIKAAIDEASVTLEYPKAWVSLKLLENDDYIRKYIDNSIKDDEVKHKVSEGIENLTSIIGYEPDAFIVDKRYELISKFVKNSVKKNEVQEESTSDKIDKVLTNKFLGIPIFAIIMFAVYQVSINFGNGTLSDLINDSLGQLGTNIAFTLDGFGVPKIIGAFVRDGVFAGVGSVLGFFPMILIMFFLISLLEDSGYMARAAYVMDRLMSAVGLHGKTAVSLIVGSGCNVAGIMSARTLESKKDRMIAILITPFISCPARLTVYGVFVGAFFAKQKLGIFSLGGIIIFLLYALGIFVAICAGKFFSSKVFEGETSYFVMELPPYRLPTLKGILIHMWEKSGHFLKKAGTIILGVCIIVWILADLPAGVEYGSKDSLLGIIGTFIAPIFKPAGFGSWQAGVALITGFAAKEAVVGTLGTIYGVNEGTQLFHAIHNTFTPLSAISFMIMTLLYVPCVATIGAVKSETNSNKWTVAVIIYTCVIGWVLATIFYQVGRLLGYV
ncbi:MULTISPECIES: ferrous iron transport protein B [Clostridium]|jgi:ferrous iron transport protein B|uniref:Ferrous iron transport protein B n=1 Tax=Clostridium acetobutylicum (strain ATCC 824 / DSM 792 / JCM 1419 / IAM 19013 / LMG 5710 / NBRC 13948 / NRRL B-527 / VKM B-1787 / 2291 / W) TaxID=272562 RepID=Q97K88_CLOAB|nr:MULTISPECIES: ferrous iron transport protein B [Clostridium]AAK79007.1 FeoB-like GTPase, responsible for iron uptake [Clostridium acetobutylicum ATCC 824]ADZ20082.1 FeoB-like GTPase, responsible for iron uptake [Clostridium acetobutylicum EA 2018]AEI34484.1 FeoB-like GTPase, responsible for iron uptake [Clostridium acetobutylicum DSM 1731]AWV81737.1 ferrous iron transport protein B [Clostridium acetobutylicum]KHD35645.1 iron transporter FeoB [Clostridium acetobutylicum]